MFLKFSWPGPDICTPILMKLRKGVSPSAQIPQDKKPKLNEKKASSLKQTRYNSFYTDTCSDAVLEEH